MADRLSRGVATRALAPSLFDASAALLCGLALAAAVAGPLRLDVGPWLVTVRTLSRPLAAALVIILVRVVMTRRAADRGRELAQMSGRVALGALAMAGVTGWFVYLSPTLGGADSYGYVSAAERILDGRLIQPEPLAPLLPIDDGTFAATPLGYVPTPRAAHASVPIYPLGLPAIMAAATVIGGREAPFVVAPLAGIVLLAVAAALAWRWYRDPCTTLVVAALLAIHPLVFTYSIQPMSDIPAAVFTLAAVLAMASERPLLAGIAAAAAIVIRPALAPAAVMLAVVEIAVRGWAGARHAALVMAPIGVAAVGQAALQTYLYGSALTSGYGGVGGLFSAERVLSNLRSYGYWAVASLGLPVIALSAVGWAVSDRAARATWVLLSGGLLALYLPYRTYDHWETLRFFLPAVVLMTILAAAGLVAIARRLAGTAGAWLVAPLVAFAMAWSWIGWLDSNNVFTMPEHERRHRFAAEMVEQSTPRDAVIMAVQHSGSVRYYAHRDTLNWERMPPGSIPDTVRALKERGRQVFLMIDSDAERAEFLTRHGDILQRDSWLPAGQRRDVQLYQAPRQERD